MTSILEFIGLPYFGNGIIDCVTYIGDKVCNIKQGISDEMGKWMNQKIEEPSDIELDEVLIGQATMMENYVS